MRRFRRRRVRSGSLGVAVITLCVLLIVYFVFAFRLMPLIKTIAVNNARNAATQTINNAAGKVIKNDNIDYDKLMSLDKDASGQITAVKANTIQIDLLKYEITNEAIDELNSINSGSLGVPVGTVVGGQLFSGLGPHIRVRIEPVGSIETQLVNEFTSAGINQTRQQIILTVKASVTIMVSSYSVTTDVSSNFTIADTVIVGKVPDSYTVVEDSSAGSESDAQKIFTYGGSSGNSSK